MSRVDLVLASASPARLRTLRDAGVDARVVVSGVDETVEEPLEPAALALLLARRKGRAVLGSAGPGLVRDGRPTVVVACDSVLEIGGRVHGKPASSTEAAERLTWMSGRSGVLHTGHFAADVASGEERTSPAATVVHFGSMSRVEIDAYVATGEPLNVAGAFTIDGLGGAFVDGVEGDPHNVVGISLPVVRRLLAALGHAWPDLWTR